VIVHLSLQNLQSSSITFWIWYQK